MRIFINDTTFRSCFTDYPQLSGGSFYWREQGSVIQFRNCYDKSWCSKSGQAYGSTASFNGINHCNFSTMHNLGLSINLYDFGIGQSQGNVFINNNNLTNCKCKDTAGVSSSSFTSLYQKFSNYRNLLNGVGPCQFGNYACNNCSFFQNLNFINNTSPDSIYFNFQKSGNATFQNCVFKDNTCNYIIRCYYSVMIIISDMYVESRSKILSKVIYSNTKVAEEVPNILLPLDENICLRTHYHIKELSPYNIFSISIYIGLLC